MASQPHERGLRQARRFTDLKEVTPHYFIDPVMAAVFDRHGELHLFALYLARMQAGLGGQHVIGIRR
jgi:hypothetical protein